MIRWEEPGYVVAFTTRIGGVSSGIYASLNLDGGNGRRRRSSSRRTGASRARQLGLDATALAFNRQVHSPDGPPGARRDARRAGRRPLERRAGAADARDRPPTACRSQSRALGRRGRSPSCTPAGAASRRASSRRVWRHSAAARSAAIVGPAIGPCCYEVGAEVAGALRRRPDRDRQPRSLGGRRARAARVPACRAVERVDLCTRCHPELFFSHRRERPGTRRPGSDRCCRLTEIRARLRRAFRPRSARRRDGGRRDEVRAARRHGGCSSRRGSTVVGENRAQDLEAKHAEYGDAFTLALHRPPAVEQGQGREPHLRRSCTRSTRTRPRAGSRCRRSCR